MTGTPWAAAQSTAASTAMRAHIWFTGGLMTAIDVAPPVRSRSSSRFIAVL